MAKFKPTNIKGANDLYSGTMFLKTDIVNKLEQSFRSYGYMPLETAKLNYLETLSHKYDEGAEIVREIYKIKDQGERDLGLRYDLTVPFCKFIAMNRNLKMPFRRFEIGKVWRNGPVKAGRVREFYQCDIDVVGDKSIAVEAEMIAMAVDIYKRLGIEPVIEYGNRKMLTQIILDAGVAENKVESVIGIVDKMKKITRQELEAELGKIIAKPQLDKLLKGFENPKKIDEIIELERLLELHRVSGNCVFAPHLARGLNIYTGTVWEVFDKAKRIASSLGGGGRYDKIITEWIDNGLEYPAVGMSFGLEPIMKVLETEMKSEEMSNVNLMIVPMVENHLIVEFTKKLRDEGISVLTWNDGRVGKAMEYADKGRIPFVVIIGEKEITSEKISVKNMRDGKSVEFGIKDAEKIRNTIRQEIWLCERK
ncbi:MAG: histidine--tRNA ligase [Firmicutes bacterium]|nr:histidine--tRNA ligase [Bacillota bacterium]